nr:receptor-like protein 56 [Coffea arabica]
MRGHSILIASWALVVSIILNGGLLCSGCFLEEKHALLDFKASLNVTTNAHLILSSWTGKEGDGANADCCTWERVRCSNITGRIVELHLSNLQENMYEDWYVNINISTFIPLKDLRTLDLRGNYFNSEVTGICSLKNLHELDVSHNNFYGPIPMCFRNLTSLRHLDLSNNILSGNIPAALITPLVHLEYLSLSGNLFGGSFSFNSLGNHSKLQGFKLGPLNNDSHVDTEDLALPPPFQLKGLYLSGCNLNNRTRKIPSFLLYQKEMRILDLSSNKLVGQIPTWLLQNNTNLEVLVLKDNSFTGPFLVDDSLGINLIQLDISNNDVSGKVPQNIGLSFPALRWLSLSGNSLEANIPQSLGNLTMAETIDLSHNMFSGEVPSQIGTGCLRLRILVLSYNNLHGNFPSGSTNLTSLETLHLDNNHFIGSISHGLSRSPSLSWLDISNNSFQGKIPSWIGNFSYLKALDMSANLLEDLSKNQLIGPLPACSELTSLKFLHLHHNMISGPISNMLSGSFNLTTLDLGYNKLSGGVPRYIGKLKELRFLLLGGNELLGHIPLHLCQLQNVTIMDLSQNKFSGPLPTCFNNISFGSGQFSTDAFFKYDQTFAFPIYFPVLANSEYSLTFSEQEIVIFTTKSRSEHYAGNILNFMSGLDLSCNQLIGAIPPEFGDLRHIRALNLSHNYLQGSIPSRLSMLNLVESLDLSYNNFSGEIPSELASLNFLSIFNVSYNNLSGRVPDTGEFANFDDRNYRGNPGLCGPLLKRSCNPFAPHPENVGDQDIEVDGAIDVAAFAWSFFASYMVIVISLVVILCVSPYYRRAWSFYIDYWILSRFYEYYRSRSSEKKQTWKVFNWNMRRR